MTISVPEFTRRYASSIFVVSAFFAMCLLNRSEHPLFAFLSFLIFFIQLPYLLLRAGLSLVTRKFSIARIYFTALGIGLLLWGWLFLSSRTHFDTRFEILLFPGSYQHCVESGVHFESNKVINVCWSKDEALGLLATEPVFSDDVVYDSSDEIALPSSQRSSEWKNAALKLPPFGVMNYEAMLLTNHFYFVRFSSESPPNL